MKRASVDHSQFLFPFAALSRTSRGENINATAANTVYVSMLNIQNLPVYDSQEAAETAGLAVGTVFTTTEGVLMVKR